MKPTQLEQTIATRRQLHRHPELKFEEFDTSALVARRLTELGYQVSTGIAITGVVGLLDTGRPGPVIALRADMDALPIVEANDFEHKSQRPGCMHACGHDGHTATMLLAAELIMEARDSLCGMVKILFQPGEEGGNGADVMIKEGVLENPRVDAIFGYHNRPGFDAGLVFAKAGPAMAGSDTYEVTLIGESGHASMPHLAVDPIYLGACLVQQLQGIAGRAKSPLQAGVITVSSFEAASSANVIPGQAKLLLNIRNDRQDTRHQLVGQLDALIAGICAPYGADYRLEHVHHVPPLVNDAAWTNKLIAAAHKHQVSEQIEQIDYMPTMGSEDFAFYLEQVPGCFFFVGNGQDSAYLHNCHYEFNDQILAPAANTFLAITKEMLAIPQT